MRAPKRGTGAERLVVAGKSGKLDGAKGSRYPARTARQAASREERAGQAKPFAISKREVWEAYQRVKANKGAAGVDSESIKESDQNLKNNLYRLWNRMSSGTYLAPAARAVGIPKKDGSERRQGIPTVADRVAQAIVKRYLEPLMDPESHEDSYGYRPGKSAHDAIAMARVPGKCARSFLPERGCSVIS